MTSETTVDLSSLFESVEARFSPSLPSDTWYLVTAAALITSADPANLAQLYMYLTKQSENNGQSSRKNAWRLVNKRFRELLLVQWVTIGAPRTTVAFWALMQVQDPGDVDAEFSRSNAALDADNTQRGITHLRRLYGDEKAASLMHNIGPDMQWLNRDVIYGLFFADESVLSAVETELINCTGIFCQGVSFIQLYRGYSFSYTGTILVSVSPFSIRLAHLTQRDFGGSCSI